MSVAAGLAAVRDTIAAAAARADRDPAEVTLIAVSKRHPVSAIVAAAAAGQRVFGENFVQELVAKRADLEAAGVDVEMHHIGHLQRNKVKQVLGAAALIHAVDSPRLLREIDKRARAAGLVQPVLVEVNIAGEDSKGGVAPGDVDALVAQAGELAGVRVDGLMAMPPLVTDPEDNRRHFAAVRELRDRLAVADRLLPHLSMGTTADYAVAVEEGATLVRVGTAIFGPRPA